jgi:hypothetical protein
MFGEIKRRTALLFEQNDEWKLQPRYLQLEGLRISALS